MPNKTSLNYLAPIIFLALFTAVACIAPTAPTPEYEPIADTISVVDSWARPSPQDGGNGALKDLPGADPGAISAPEITNSVFQFTGPIFWLPLVDALPGGSR